MKMFQKPYKYDLMRGFITEYKVNGIDSLNLLGAYQNQNNIFCKQSVYHMEFVFADANSGAERNRVRNNCLGEITYGWNSNYDYLYIYNKYDTFNIKKNLFIESGLNWKVLKLVPAKKSVFHQLKIQSMYNGNTYEVQFN